MARRFPTLALGIYAHGLFESDDVLDAYTGIGAAAPR
jgi:hypothetical protein